MSRFRVEIPHTISLNCHRVKEKKKSPVPGRQHTDSLAVRFLITQTVSGRAAIVCMTGVSGL